MNWTPLKATGPDNIPAHFLKLCAIIVAPILTFTVYISSIYPSIQCST